MHLSHQKLVNIFIIALAAVALAMIVLLIIDLTSNDTADQGGTEPIATAAAAAPTAAPTAEQETESAPVYINDYYKDTVLDLARYEGKTVLINYFTEWCPYCMEEMPDIKKAYDTYDPNSLAIILVHPWDGEDATNSASVVAKYGLEGVTVIEDEDFALVGAIGVPGYPTSVIVDQAGYLYDAVASMISFEWLASAFDDLGVPLRDGAAEISSDN
ncbi:MAG: TlpA family protein disulfide reductase [Clostridiales bacterium]|nr:TlpA family protein disulfide reductase [Clostridiales bacterium]